MAVIVCEKAIAENDDPGDSPECGAIHEGRIVDGGPDTQKAIAPARPDDPEPDIVDALRNTADYFPICIDDSDFPDRDEIVAYRAPWDDIDKSEGDLFTKNYWTRYRGPLGGEGYVNTVTGEVRYTGSDRSNVGEGYHGADPETEQQAVDNVREADGDEVAAVVAPLVGMETDELVAEAKQWYGNSEGASTARRAVEHAMDDGDDRVRDVIDALAELPAPDESDHETDEDYSYAGAGTANEGDAVDLGGGFTVEASLTAKEWQPYEGPRGGEGWYNPQTNEVRYQDEEPADSDIEGADGELTDVGFRDVDSGHIISVGIRDYDWDTGEYSWTDETIQVTTANPREVAGQTADGDEVSFTKENIEQHGNYRINGLYQQTPETDPEDLIPDEKVVQPTAYADLEVGDFAILEYYGQHYGAKITGTDEAHNGTYYTVEYATGETGDLFRHSLGDGQADPRLVGVADDLELPDQYDGEYDPGEVNAMPAGNGADYTVPFGDGAVILDEAWQWGVDSVWATSDGEPRFDAIRGIDGINSDTFGWVEDGVDEPGWYRYPDREDLRDDEPRDFLGIVGDDNPVDVSYDPDPDRAADTPLDLEAAATEMHQVIESEREKFEFTEAKKYAGELVAEGATFDALVDIVTHGLEGIGRTVNQERDLNEAADIALNGVKRYLHKQAQPHPSYDGDLSLGSVDPDFRDDFVSDLSDETQRRAGAIMDAWVEGQGSMVDENTIPLYLLADQEYDNDFLPTRQDRDEVIQEYRDKTGGVIGPDVTTTSPDMDADHRAIEEYRETTVEAYREAFGDTITVFRGYNPDEHSKGKQAREALQADDPPDEIEIRNGVLNSWSTDPMVAHQFSMWTHGDTPGVVLKRELPVEHIWASADTAPELWSKEAEIIAGNPREVEAFDRENVFLPEEFDPASEARAMVNETTEKAKASDTAADGDTLRLDWEMASQGWLHRLLAARDDNGVVKTIVKDASAWQPYDGPRGGQGWYNPQTNEVRYQTDPPEGAAVADDGPTDEAVTEALTDIRTELTAEVAESDPDDPMVAHSLGGISNDRHPILPSFDDPDQTVELGSNLAKAGLVGLAEGIDTFTTNFGPADSEEFASYWSYENELKIQDNFTPDDIAEKYEIGETVADDMEWLVLHELAHHNHHQAIEAADADKRDVIQAKTTTDIETGEYEWDQRKAIGNEVSWYATVNVGEFVAEVFAGLCLGVDYSDDVMELYDHYHGPDGWRDYREMFHADGPPMPPNADRDTSLGKAVPATPPYLSDALRAEARAVLEGVRAEMEKATMDDQAYRRQRGRWQRYQGPRGGTGYINNVTGEVVYGDEMPGRDNVDYEVDDSFPNLPRGYRWDYPTDEFDYWEDGDFDLDAWDDAIAGNQVLYFDGDGHLHWGKVEGGAMTENEAGTPVEGYVLEGRAEVVPSYNVQFEAQTGDEPDFEGWEIGGDGMAMDTEDIVYEISHAIDMEDTHSVLDTNNVDYVDEYGFPQLVEDQLEEVRDSLEAYFDRGEVAAFATNLYDWKNDSKGGRSDTHEVAFKEALGIESASRVELRADDAETAAEDYQFTIDESEITGQYIKIAEVMHELSKVYWAVNFGDGTTLHRGISDAAFEDLMDEWLADPTREEFALNHAALANYTPDQKVADNWGRSTATVGVDATADTVALAADQIANFSDENSIESEVHLIGDGVTAKADDIRLWASIPATDDTDQWMSMDFKRFFKYTVRRYVHDRAIDENADPPDAHIPTILTVVNAAETFKPKYANRSKAVSATQEYFEAEAADRGIDTDSIGATFAETFDTDDGEKALPTIDLTHPEDLLFMADDVSPHGATRETETER